MRSNPAKLTGCPTCAKTGFDPAKPGFYYVIATDGRIIHGITNSFKQRWRKNYSKRHSLDDILFLIRSDPGESVKQMEAELNKALADHRCPVDEDGEKRESFCYTPEVRDIINSSLQRFIDSGLTSTPYRPNMENL